MKTLSKLKMTLLIVSFFTLLSCKETITKDQLTMDGKYIKDKTEREQYNKDLKEHQAEMFGIEFETLFVIKERFIITNMKHKQDSIQNLIDNFSENWKTKNVLSDERLQQICDSLNKN